MFDYISKYFKHEKKISIKTGEKVDVYLLEDILDPKELKLWADQFRQNYCKDADIDVLRKGYELTRKDFLEKMKFPDASEGFGPGTRSGDFSELLISDYLEFVHDFIIPKDRYNSKFNRNTSSQGTDVLGLKMLNADWTPDDEMIIFEVKCMASKRTKSDNRLQAAIKDSYKDYIKKGEMLNAINERALREGNTAKSNLIVRFQNEVDRPYKMRYGAAAVYDEDKYSEKTTQNTSVDKTELVSPDWLIVVKHKDLMTLINELYKEAANC